MKAASAKASSRVPAKGAAPPRYTDNAARRPGDELLALQRAAGNSAVQRLLRPEHAEPSCELFAPGREGRALRRRGLHNAALGEPRPVAALAVGTPYPAHFLQRKGPSKSVPKLEVRKALEKFANADDSVLEAAATAYAKASAEKNEVELGKGAKGSGSIDLAAQGGAWARAEAVQLANDYALLARAGVVAGASVNLTGELAKDFGSLKTKLQANLAAFAGAYAKASGGAILGTRSGLSLSGTVEGFLGVKSSQSAEGEFSIGSLGGAFGLDSEEMVGLGVSAQGEFAITKGSIVASGEISALAGAQASGEIKGKAKLYGRDALTGALQGQASVGAGFQGSGGFRISRGVVELNLHGGVTVGVGGGAGGSVAVDLKPIAVWIWRQTDKAIWSVNYKKAEDMLQHPEDAESDLTQKVQQYATRKIDLIWLNRADNFVKDEKVQALIGKVLPRKQVKGHRNAQKVDEVIKRAVESGIKHALRKRGILTGVRDVAATVKDGKLVKLDKLPSVEQVRQQRLVMGRQREPLPIESIVLKD